jgi:hypothetical protein
MNWMQARYMYSSLNESRMSGSWMLFGFRCLWPAAERCRRRGVPVRPPARAERLVRVRTLKLSGAEEERQEVVVVEAPDAVRAGRFEPVRFLQDAHDLDVAGSLGPRRKASARGLPRLKSMSSERTPRTP